MNASASTMPSQMMDTSLTFPVRPIATRY